MREQIFYDIPTEWLENKSKKLCPPCGKPKTEWEKGRRVYCSQECSRRYSNRILTWTDFRKKILRERGEECESCGLTEEKENEDSEKRYEEAVDKWISENPLRMEKARAELLKEADALYALAHKDDKEIVNSSRPHIYSKPHAIDYQKRVCFELDHIMPVSKGGAMWDDGNLQVLCVGCHKKKTKEDMKK